LIAKNMAVILSERSESKSLRLSLFLEIRANNTGQRGPLQARWTV
jgi:hypothetical protein